MVSVVDPALVVLAGGVLTAGGPRLRDLIADELGSLAAARPRLELASVTETPVLAGALHTALPRPATRSSTPSDNSPPTRATPGPSPGESP